MNIPRVLSKLSRRTKRSKLNPMDLSQLMMAKNPISIKLPKRKTRSTTQAEKSKAAVEPEPELGSPSKKPKLSEEEPVSPEVALAKVLEAMNEEENGEGPGEAGSKSDEASVPPPATSAETLVTVPNAKVHLLGEPEESVLLASGDFTISRIIQRGSVVAVLAKVGDELQWPLARDAPALKLTENRYVFSLRVPVILEDETEEATPSTKADASSSAPPLEVGPETKEASGASTSKADVETSHATPVEVSPAKVDATSADASSSKVDKPLPTPATAVLHYGVTFQGELNAEVMKELDKLLESYSSFIPVPLLTTENEIVEEPVTQDGEAERKELPRKSDSYWKQAAPSDLEYNSAIAKTIASSSGHLVKGILWVSDLIATQIERGGLFMQQYIKPKRTPAKISPKTMKNLQRVKRLSKMTENLTIGMLSGVVTATGTITSSVLKSRQGAKLFGMLPGEAALATLDAFVRVFDALELAGKNVMSRTSLVTCQVVSHRYGDEAAAFAKAGLSTAGHVVSTAWTISKIRTAIDPTKASKSPVFMKAAATAAADELKDKRV